MTEENKTTDAPVPGSPDYPLHSELTIGAYLKQQVAIDPDHEFVVYPDRDLRWTYKDFDERTDALAKGLLAIGMKPGDQLRMHVEKIKARRNVYVFRGEAKVDGQVVSEAEFTAMIME